MGTYRVFNLVVLGFLLYVLVFSLISPVMEKLFPSVIHCYYKEYTGNPCPFCGLTRDMSCLLTGNGEQERVNSRFQLFLTVYAVEWVIRIFTLLMSRRFTGKTLPAIDVAIHCVIAVMVLYAFNTV